jgi:hypothetical protein
VRPELWSSPSLYRKDRILIGLCSMAVSLLVIGVGWVKAKKVVRRKLLDSIQVVEKRTGWPIEIGSWSLGPGFVTVEDIRMGPEGNLLISEVTVVPSLNPINKDFGRPAHLSIGSLRLKAPQELLVGMKGQIGETQVASKKTENDEPLSTNENSWPRGAHGDIGATLSTFFRALPAELVDIKSAGVEILDTHGEPLLSLKKLKLRIHRADRKILMQAASFALKDHAPEPMVEGRLGLSQDSDFRFFVRRRGETKKAPYLWALSGSADSTLSHFQLFSKTRELPVFLTEQLSAVLGKDFRFETSGRIKAAREGDLWRFAIRMRSKNISFVSPMISKDPIGPVQFDLVARGSFSKESQEVTLENASISLPSHGKGAKDLPPLSLGLVGFGSFSTEPGLGFRLAASLDLQPTSCQTILDTAPIGMIPKIEDFKLGGKASGRLEIRFDSRLPENSEVTPQNLTWNCSVDSEPERYAAAKLREPFLLEKSEDSPHEVETRVLSPTNPNYRSLREMSASVPLAFIASEDASFYAHKGIDSSAIEGAFKRNLTEGRIAVGGSTITMQTAKNLFLSSDRTISRKLQELFFAWNLERVLTKERILEIYLNIVEFGPGIFGITHASKHYFNKEPASLSLTESAYLASLLPSPKNRYVSFCRGQLTPGLSNILSGLLRRMLNLGRISSDSFETASVTDLRFNEQARLASAACSAQKDQARN